MISGGAILGFFGAIKLCRRDGYDPAGVFNLVLEHVMANERKPGPFDSEFEKGYIPMDSPPGFEEREYKAWKDAGGEPERCEHCGYTEHDKRINGDHYICDETQVAKRATGEPMIS